ncbi:hypothetical protein [Atopomonas sediminilitoris]|uniref:hypothetical protein n=1 Tax=Atopomonas sediminilitoris TaxID=2919919 RepID=UPI001F4D6358|nr:hypothetical protein [Atopomonas sediminilitoris]MCJ8170457.1 hypothetical protein [Atopomonas sediminilitoris]
MSSYWKTCLVSALAHGLGLVLFVVTNDIAHHLYLLWNGGFGSRGIAPGAVFYLVLLVFSVANLLVVFIPFRKVKYGAGVVFSIATAALLLPQHPLRALFYVASGWLVIVVCIYVSSWLSNKFAYEGGR